MYLKTQFKNKMPQKEMLNISQIKYNTVENSGLFI